MRPIKSLPAVLFFAMIGLLPGHSQSDDRVDLELPSQSWTFNNGPEFHPGGSGGVTKENEEQKKTVRIDYDFSKGGAYVAARTATQLPEGLAQLRFKAKADNPVKLAFRLVDSSGQIHQTVMTYSDLGEWQTFRVPFTKSREHFGGKNDGIVHYPIKAVEICVQRTSETGYVRFADFEVQK